MAAFGEVALIGNNTKFAKCRTNIKWQWFSKIFAGTDHAFIWIQA